MESIPIKSRNSSKVFVLSRNWNKLICKGHTIGDMIKLIFLSWIFLQLHDGVCHKPELSSLKIKPSLSPKTSGQITLSPIFSEIVPNAYICYTDSKN